MLRRLSPALAAAFVLSASSAAAHPHVFVTVKSTMVYEAGAPKAVRHAWRFDDMFSAFAVQGLDTDTDGKLSREELQALAEVNVTSLKEFDFFTFGQAGGGDVAFSEPVDYWLDYDGTALTLNFTLPVVSALKSDTLRIEIYDPSYFVSFALAEEAPASLEGAPADCRIDAEEPGNDAASGGQLTEEFFSNLQPGSSWGKQFANVMVARCGADALAYAETLKPKEPEPTPAPQPMPAADTALARVMRAIDIAEAAPLQPMPEGPSANSWTPSLGAFGVVRPDGAAAPPGAGLFGWVAQQQSAFYRKMSEALSASKADGSAFLLLAGLSFAYGIFHAAGPGHGKAVISSYLLATGETLRRGVAISFAAAMAQAMTAIAVVGVLAVAVGATSQAMGITAWWLEAASYALIVLLGLTLLFRTVRGAVRALRGAEHVHDHTCGPECGHSHAPAPNELEGAFSWRRAASAVLAVGLRPCTGALLVLVFALAQGLIWTGIAATFAMALGTAVTVSAIAALAVCAKGLALRLASTTSGGSAVLALRGVEVLAGFAVLAFGLMLLGGLLVTNSVAG